MPIPTPGDLPDPEMKPAAPALQADSLLLNHQLVAVVFHRSLGKAYLSYHLSTSDRRPPDFRQSLHSYAGTILDHGLVFFFFPPWFRFFLF